MANEGRGGGGFDNQGPVWRRRVFRPDVARGSRPPRPEQSAGSPSTTPQLLSDFGRQLTSDPTTLGVVRSVTETLLVPDNQRAAAHDTIARLNSFAYRVRQLDAAPADQQADAKTKIPSLTREIFHDVELGPNDIKQIPLLVTILDQTNGKSFETATEIQAAMQKVHDMRNTDAGLAQKILKKLLDRAEEVGVKDQIDINVREQVQQFFELGRTSSSPETPKEETSHLTEADIQRLIKEARIAHKDRFGRVSGIIKTVKLPDETIEEISKRIKERHTVTKRDGKEVVTASAEGMAMELKAAIFEIEDKVRNNLTRAYHQIFDSITEDEFEPALQDFCAMVDEYGAFFSPAYAAQLKNEAKAAVKSVLNIPSFENARRDGQRELTPTEILEQTGDLQFLEGQNVLIDILSNASKDPEALVKYFEVECGKDWNEFYDRVRRIFEHVLARADTRPDDFFDQGFNQFTTRRVYDKLIGVLQQSAASLSRIEMEPVKIKDNDYIPSYEQMRKQGKEVVGGKVSSPRVRETDMSFARAVSDYLPRSMIQLMTTTEYFHNANVISNLGMGFEQMSKFAERLSTTSLDWLYHHNPRVNQAYQYFISSLKQLAASENYISPTEFGFVDQTEGLDPVQRHAFYRMLADLPEGERGDLQKRDEIKRLTRIASGIAKGGTGDYWQILLDSRLMISWKEKEGVFSVNQIYTSSNDAGMEKMLATIDPDLLLERFALPPEWHNIRYVYQPRYWDEYEGWSKEGFSHTYMYRIAKLTADAQFRGRTDELKKHDEENVVLRDLLHTNVIGLFARAGWRFSQYDSAYAYHDVEVTDKDTGLPKTEQQLDTVTTLDRMRKIGLYMTKRFLDDNDDKFAVRANRPERWRDDEELDEAYAEYMRMKVVHENLEKRQKRRSRGNHYGITGKGLGMRIGNSWVNERKVHAQYERARARMRERLYELEIFDRITDIRPSKWLSTERRRFTPKGERTLFERLHEVLNTRFTEADGYPKNFIEKKLYPVCVSALSTAEDYIWRTQVGNNIFDYTLTEEMIFDNPEVMRRVTALYTEHQAHTGKLEDSNFEDLSLRKLTPNEFVDVLRQFYRELKAGIADTRRLSVEPTKLDKNNKPLRSTEEDALLRETLGARYAHFMHHGIGNLDKVLGGDDFDNTEFLHMGAGKRVPARILGDTHKIETKMTPALMKLLGQAIPEYAHHGYRDINKEAIKEGALKILVPPIHEAAEVITQLSAHAGHEFSARMWAFMPRIFGVDAMYRMPLLGPVLQGYMGRLKEDEPNFVSDFFRNRFGFRTTALESDGVAALIRAGIDGLHIARSEFVRHGAADVDLSKHPIATWFHDKVGNLPLIGETAKAISGIFIRPSGHFERTKWSFESLNRISGPDTLKERVGQYWIMWIAAIGAAGLAAAILANQINKKKSGEAPH